MTEAIGDVIHGGNIVVRERVDNLYAHRTSDAQRTAQDALIDEARRLYPWAPKGLAVIYGQTSTDYQYYLTVTLAVPDRVRSEAIQERIKAAESTRCACGRHGSWDHSVNGTSEGIPCIWAGCPNCPGSAVGRPLRTADWAWYQSRR